MTDYKSAHGNDTAPRWLDELPALPIRPFGAFHNVSNPDQAGDWYASQREGGNEGSMLEIVAAQLRYALESDEPSAAMRATLTTAQNALNRVCRNCAGEHWEDAADGGRCVNCGTRHPEAT